jgi:DNA topoisomerase-1
MPKNLLIVESPTKAKTIQKYLGPDFEITASVGHVKDLPVNRLGVEPENAFKAEYVTIKGKSKVVKALKDAAKRSEAIYLGPDPDREGEAIAWHIAEELKGKDRKIFRVLFNELTPKAIKDAVADPKPLNQDKFESQQARRILDRLVGYQISPLLWSKVRRGLSAGRVQSVALRMICDREREIQAFEPQEYWSLTAHLGADAPPPFKARLAKYEGEKIELKSEAQTQAVVAEVRGRPFTVAEVAKRQKKRNPFPPFTTSLLQQEAYKKLGFPAKKTMSVAQNLYEGIALGDQGQVGLITYMRTDSYRLSENAVSEAREYIAQEFGKEFLPARANRYQSPKGAQEAHEAIRPTSVRLRPDAVADYLSKDQLALYALIWKRFLACQMTPAVLDQTTAEIEAGKALFRASGSVVVFKGFTVLYDETANGTEPGREGEESLPPLKPGDGLNLIELEPAQHFTQPPPRYSEASLIKALEENGIGRPSTYAAILGNINERDYVTVDKGRFRPTELGFMVTALLVKSFPDILDTAFTAQMEKDLDRIERGETTWTSVLTQFYGTFHRDLEKAQKEMKGEIATGLSCARCQRPMVIKSGRNGLFLACSGYPECRNTANYTRDGKGRILIEAPVEAEASGIQCGACGRPMLIRQGRFGRFLACSGYPECRNTKALEPEVRVPCPAEGCDGTLVERTSKKGRKFWACNRYPACRFVMWDEPHEGTCPVCGTAVLKVVRRENGIAHTACRNKGCGYKTPLETPVSEDARSVASAN